MPLFGEAKKKYQREWMADRRVQGLKYLGGKCIKCGITYNLNVDHKDPKKKVSHRIWSWSWDRVITELDKCQLLCETHHKEKTEINKERPHGSNNTNATITETTVLEIRKRYIEESITQKELAKQYGLSKQIVSSIITRRTWKHI